MTAHVARSGDITRFAAMDRHTAHLIADVDDGPGVIGSLFPQKFILALPSMLSTFRHCSGLLSALEVGRENLGVALSPFSVPEAQ